MSKSFLKYSFILFLFAASLIIFKTEVYAITSGVDFNTSTDLTDNFNDDGSPEFTAQATGGINNTGSVNVPIPSNDLWVTKQAYSVTGEAGSVYTFSAYFKVAQNGGYGNLGFTNASSASPSGIGQPPTGLGANFHGGGGAFVNNGVQTTLSWPPDLVLGNWYWMTFEVTTKGSNTFDLKLQIWNTDSTGTIGTMKTEKTLNGVVNTDMGTASTIHGFFSAAGSRMDTIDNFEMDLVGATFIEEGAPVVISSAVSNIASSSADAGGNVTDENGAAVTAKGVCWSTSQNPTTADDCTANGTGTGSYSSTITGLAGGTLYYVRAYATNSSGTSYGEENSFTTAVATPDADGIDNTLEDNGPNSGDANNDSIPDSEQATVGSIPNAEDGSYISLEVTNTCNNITTMQSNVEADFDADSEYSYPQGLIQFVLSGCTSGGTTNITQYYYGVLETENLILRKFNANTNSYITIDSATIDTITIGSEEVVRVRYSITDGGELDLDGTANGEIVDPAGVALSTPGIPDTGLYAFDNNGGAINSLAVIGATVVTVSTAAFGWLIWYYKKQYAMVK